MKGKKNTPEQLLSRGRVNTPFCPDSEGLGYSIGNNFRLGHVSEFNGANATEVPGFVPTRHELLQLVKYWATLQVGVEYEYVILGGVSSSGLRSSVFASRRTDRIARLIGDGEVSKAIEESEQEFSEDCNPKFWAIFKNRTWEEQEAFRGLLKRLQNDPPTVK